MSPPVRCLSIPPEGLIVVSDHDPANFARVVVNTESLDVVVARALGRDRVHVMWVDDWGLTKDLPINRRAWALYGGSPIYGTAVLAADDQLPLDDWVVAMVADPEFPPPPIQRFMDKWLEAHP